MMWNVLLEKTGRRLLFIVGLMLFIMNSTTRADHMCGQKPSKPNIVFVLADDLGWTDVNIFDPLKRAYYETPNLDRLAGEGMIFTQAYSNAANSAPTRAALLSGQYYPHQPIYHAGSPGQGELIPAPNAHSLPLEKVTMAEALKQDGYRTAFIGKWHIGKPPESGPQEQGFEINIGGNNAGNPGGWKGGYFEPYNNPFIDDAEPGGYLTDYLTRKAQEYIRAPLIIRWPRIIEPGSHCNDPVIGTDFYPTLLAAAGIQKPRNYLLDGKNLMPLLKGESTFGGPRALYWHFPGYPNNIWRTTPVSALRYGKWKLIKFYEEFYRSGEVELYDLRTDIGEKNNVADQHPAITRDLQNKLEIWLEKNNAPTPMERRESVMNTNPK